MQRQLNSFRNFTCWAWLLFTYHLIVLNVRLKMSENKTIVDIAADGTVWQTSKDSCLLWLDFIIM